jgi:saccharopine dehydrogenase-like NADP-dependent oxidoreductase
MRKILLLGAGKSSSTLIQYLYSHGEQENWLLRVGDVDADTAAARFPEYASIEWFRLDANNIDLCRSEISQSDLVISMLPAFMHTAIAGLCIELAKHLITPSYVSPEMQLLHADAVRKGVIFLNEMGLDPGIDHMSAMAILDNIRERGGEMKSFESFTGGLVAPESDNNPWHYKISWNPRNIVMAGAGGSAKYLQNHRYNYIPYQHLFERTTPIDLGDDGVFEGYANRDSLKYRSVYGLDAIPSLIRGTLRKSPFCKAWNVLVNIGLTDESFEIEKPENLSWCDLLCAFTGQSDESSLKAYIIATYRVDDEVMSMLDWLGLFSDRKIGSKTCTPALALQWLLEEKWKLNPEDKDMVVMYHRFVYTLEGNTYEHIATLVDIGSDAIQTSMARTVGLPVAIAAKMILNGKITTKGVLMPVQKEIYQPVLDELTSLGIRFTETLRVI